MRTSILGSRWVAASVAVALALSISLPVAHGAAAPCWVRNVHQDTYGGSLIRMVERANDGDHLRVRGTCPGTIVIDADIEIVGRGEAPTLDGRRRERVLKVQHGVRVEIRDLIVEGGDTKSWFGGGGILNFGTLRLVRVVVQGNSSDEFGGGIASDGTLTVVDSIVRRNDSEFDGGGLGLEGTTLLVRTRVVANHAVDVGGGLWNHGPLTIRDSVIARNTGDRGPGGGIMNSEPLTLIGSTVRANVVRRRHPEPGMGSGGGIANESTLDLMGSTVTRNSSAEEGGGVWNSTDDEFFHLGTVTLDAASSVAGNTPDACVGTTAC